MSNYLLKSQGVKKFNRILLFFIIITIVLVFLGILHFKNNNEVKISLQEFPKQEQQEQKQNVEEIAKPSPVQAPSQPSPPPALPQPIAHKPIIPKKPDYVVPDVQMSIFEPKRVVALVFFGRKPVVRILIRYLEANLKKNGGVLDKILFAARSAKKEDIEYLDEITSQNKEYYEKLNIPMGVGYTRYYELLQDDDLVFKIDDDVVFIQNGTFERMIKEYMSKNLLFLSANVVNHALLSFVHAKIKAILPFIEKEPYKWGLDLTKDLSNTIAAHATYDGFSACWWNSGQCATMAHESFLYHINNDTSLKAYDFKYWDFHSNGYIRWSINFFLGRGKYLNKMGDSEFDELMISKEIPQRVDKHCYAMGNSVVVHLHYTVQVEYVMKTNLLEKYDKLSKKYLNIK